MKNNKKKTKTNEEWVLSENKVLCFILLIGLFLRLTVLYQHGNSLSIESDDLNYIYGGINFLRTKQITHGLYGASEHAMLVMPGFPILLSLIFTVTGYTQNGLIYARVVFILFGIGNILLAYKIARKLFNIQTAILTSFIMAISPPIIQYDNMFLTETVFTFFVLQFIYYVLKFADSKNNKDFILLLIFYILALLIRANMALLPFAFIFYFYQKKFPLKDLIIKGCYAVLLISIVLTPWWIRNYKVVGEFVPTTAGMGDALLAGTYYGNAPETEYTLEDTQILFTDPDSTNILHERMKKQEQYAKYRMEKWIDESPKDFIKTYFIKKPAIAWYHVNLPLEILGILRPTLQKIYYISLSITVLGVIYGFTKKKYRHSTLLCVLILVYNTILSAITVPMARYNFPVMPFYFMFFSLSVQTFYSLFQEKIEGFLAFKKKEI